MAESVTPGIRVRRAVTADAGFIAAGNQAMAWETEGRALDPAVVDRGVRRLLAQPGYGFYLVAEVGGQPLGSLLVTYEWSDWRDGLLWWLQSVYVAPEQRRRGVFRSLLAHLKTLAAADPEVRGLRLYVEKANVAAQATYQRLGLKATGYRVMAAELPPAETP